MALLDTHPPIANNQYIPTILYASISKKVIIIFIYSIIIFIILSKM